MRNFVNKTGWFRGFVAFYFTLQIPKPFEVLMRILNCQCVHSLVNFILYVTLPILPKLYVVVETFKIVEARVGIVEKWLQFETKWIQAFTLYSYYVNKTKFAIRFNKLTLKHQTTVFLITSKNKLKGTNKRNIGFPEIISRWL